MLSQLTAFLAALIVAAPVLLKFGVAVGAFGSALEGLGILFGKFTSPKLKSAGTFLVHAGKLIEAASVDSPKVIANAVSGAKAVLEFLARLKGSAPLALFLVLCFGAVACFGASPAPCAPQDPVMIEHAAACAARVRIECTDVPDSECPVIAECDAWGEERCGFSHTGASGSAGAK